MAAFHLLGISGSLRRAAPNRTLVHEAARLSGADVFVEADLNLPLYDGDLEAAEGQPEAAKRLVQKIAEADAIVISTPEYNKGPSGVLKNALDWVSRSKPVPWQDKPVAVMSAAAGRAGGERAQMILRSFLVPFQPRVISGPELHLAQSGDQFDENGHLTSDLYRDTLQRLMDRLRAEASR